MNAIASLLWAAKEDRDRSQKVLAGGRKGHETTYGTEDEKARKWQAQQDYIDGLHREYPDLNRGQLNEKAARKFGVSTKTIQRHTKNPRK